MCVFFGRNPDRLCLNGQFDGFRVFIEACEPILKFEKLKALDLEVLSILFQDPSDQHEDKAILMNTVAPFVRCHAHSRNSRSRDPVDFSDFYDYMAATDFPSLKALNIRMPFDQTLGQPKSLKRFLLSCRASLEGLELRLQVSHIWKIKPFISEEFCGSSTLVPLGPLSEELLGTWLIDLVQSESGEIPTFPRLRKLDFHPTNTAAGLQALLVTIHGTAPTLLDLIIRYRFFPPNEAKVVVNTTSGRLKFQVVGDERHSPGH